MTPDSPRTSVKLRIRTKFIGILILAAVLPLCLALLAVRLIGYRNYRQAQGALFQSRAEHLANTLNLTVNEQVHALTSWTALSDLAQKVGAIDAAQPAQSDEAFHTQINETEARWPALTANSDELRGFLEHPLAAELRAFQAVHPLFVEVFITDAKGRLIASSEKTSDYWQADEDWWQRAWLVKELKADVEGINYDASADVYSLDVAVPIRDRLKPAEAPVGVIKGVLNASPLLAQGGGERETGIRHVVLADGRILVQLGGPHGTPLQQSITPQARRHFDSDVAAGWMISPITSDAPEIAGFSRLQLGDGGPGLATAYALVHDRTEIVLAPVQGHLTTLSIAGAAVVLLFGLAGYWIAGKKLIEPIEMLRAATRNIAASVKFESRQPLPSTLPALDPLHLIHTRDEIGELARDFTVMAARVLTYQERLESDLATKTEAMERDLDLAREFQEALMPHGYPKVPTEGDGGVISLDFHHIYQPASSVGGDFFDVLKLSDHTAGVFIADVMGHGARSALVTAILRALLQNLAFGTEDPAHFLSLLNRHFHAIIRESKETMFVSAFYVIIDTQDATAVCASAGHPSPFVANRQTGDIHPMLGPLRANPALGIFPEATYSKWSRIVQAGDLLLLFTDGIHEAQDAQGEEFGFDRMRAAIRSALDGPGHELGQAVVDAVHTFLAPAAPGDDICMVTVEILPAQPPIQPSPNLEPADVTVGV